MSTFHSYASFQDELRYFKKVMSLDPIYGEDPFVDVQVNSDSHAILTYRSGMQVTLQGRDFYNTPVFTRIDTHFEGAHFGYWTGTMSVEQFLDGWPETTTYHSDAANLVYAYEGDTSFANGGNDFIFMDGGVVYGGSGQDTFIIEDGGVIMDYQAGEKLLFPEFDSWEEFYEAFSGYDIFNNGFVLYFDSQWEGEYELEFRNFRPESLRQQDVILGDGTQAQAALKPLIDVVGSPDLLFDALFF